VKVRSWSSPPVRRTLLVILCIILILDLLPSYRYLKDLNESHQRTQTTQVGQPYGQSDHLGGAQSSLSILNEKSGPPFCLVMPSLGRTNNRIISIASALTKARENGTNLALLSYWSNFFTDNFEPHPEIITKDSDARHLYPSSENECSASVDGLTAFWLYGGPSNEFIYAISEILPKRSTRERAVAILSDNFGISGSDVLPPSMPFFSVHRRWLEGTCHNKISMGICSPELAKQACDIDFETVQSTYNPLNLTTILFTDKQNDDLDNTFPIHSDNEFVEEMWMMTLSRNHYGSPLSTVDHVVMHWRYGLGNFGTIEPASCFPRHSWSTALMRKGIP